MTASDTMIPDAHSIKEVFNFDVSRDCFGCGPDNPIGLHMRFFTDGEKLVSFLQVPRHHCGWSSIVHGGIVTTILDETMSWTAHHLIKKLILTKSIHIDFHRPVHVARDIRCEGRIKAVNSPREAVMDAVIYDDSGNKCATGQGTFALLTPAVARRLGVIEERVVKNFENFILKNS
ncbi:MAG: PaaI family thioesterase [Pseudomonadota bacterium]